MESWIFDVDGTIADPTHRRGYVQNKPKRWDLWNKTMHLDAYHHDIIEFVHYAIASGREVIICTGREDTYREVTEEWFRKGNIPFDKMYMRKAKDYRSDDIVKEEMYHELIKDGYNPVLVFDDRNSVVAKWRELGLRCIQVNQGDF